jgi:phosphoribosyl-ATP pyrophosphohydrolase
MTDNVQQKPIEEMTVVELKALWYDNVVLLQETQNVINIIQEELIKRQKSSNN